LRSHAERGNEIELAAPELGNEIELAAPELGNEIERKEESTAMSIHLQREIERLKKCLLSLCAVVENQVQMAIEAFLQRDEAVALVVERRDNEVDQREVEVEEECLKMLALYQPVATDLRLIVSALKINNDLEQIGDLAVNIARKTAATAAEPPLEISVDIVGMWEKVQAMLRDSLDALVNTDAELAESVYARDDEVDAMKHEMRKKTEEAARRQPELMGRLLRFLAVVRNLERIADYSVNIAEDVIYMVNGAIVRHRDRY
jgi:phosphate transport system protein